MVKVRMHYIYESHHKDRSTRISVCVCVFSDMSIAVFQLRMHSKSIPIFICEVVECEL